MATNRKTPVDTRSKSARLRDDLVEAESLGVLAGSLSRLAAKNSMGYAFAYGVADRFAHPEGGTYADRAAARRATKAVTIAPDGSVTIVTTKGLVRVTTDGVVSRPKV